MKICYCSTIFFLFYVNFCTRKSNISEKKKVKLKINKKSPQKWVIILGNRFWCHLQTKNIETRETIYDRTGIFFLFFFPHFLSDKSSIRPAYCFKIQNTSAIIFDCFNGGKIKKRSYHHQVQKFSNIAFSKPLWNTCKWVSYIEF